MEELRALTSGVLTLGCHAKENVMETTRDRKIDYNRIRFDQFRGDKGVLPASVRLGL